MDGQDSVHVDAKAWDLKTESLDGYSSNIVNEGITFLIILYTVHNISKFLNLAMQQQQ